jgi:hypothetical protein
MVDQKWSKLWVALDLAQMDEAVGENVRAGHCKTPKVNLKSSAWYFVVQRKDNWRAIKNEKEY